MAISPMIQTSMGKSYSFFGSEYDYVDSFLEIKRVLSSNISIQTLKACNIFSFTNRIWIIKNLNIGKTLIYNYMRNFSTISISSKDNDLTFKSTFVKILDLLFNGLVRVIISNLNKGT